MQQRVSIELELFHDKVGGRMFLVSVPGARGRNMLGKRPEKGLFYEHFSSG